MEKETGKGRELLIMRHAKSSWDAGTLSDLQRPLSGRGRDNAPRMGRWLMEEDLLPDLLLVSPAQRAQETAALLAERWETAAPELQTLDGLYGAPLHRLLEVLAGLPATVRRPMLVGHNPGLEYLVVHLAGGHQALSIDGKVFPTAALAHFRMPESWRELPAGEGELVRLQKVRDLRS